MKEGVNALSSDMDPGRMKAVIDRVGRNSKEVDEIVDTLVSEYCEELDQYMNYIDSILVAASDKGTEITDVQLDEFTLNLPSILYSMSGAQESLGIKEDVSTAIRNDVYNRVREKAQGTVADKDTAAELQCITETIISIAYSRAYKKVKLRVEAAYEMLNSVKKVVSRRIAEVEKLGGE
jgi:predicted house-cleaning noncanonical NTP pyrophosphatase (MazG superfamily)